MSELDDDRDEEWFKEIYGTEYTGPRLAAGATKRGPEPALPKAASKHALNSSDSEEDDEPRDPNAVPTDFTSREAKVWEAKAKAVERNWKRRKEEEFTCRLCGEVGHFAQGCPTTLGGKRRSGEVVEAISLRDKRLKPRLIGTGGVIVQGIEKETGCRLKLEDNLNVGNGSFYVKITGPDRVTVNKAMACVNKLVNQVEDEWKQQAGTRKSQGRERERAEGSFEGGTNASVNAVVFSQTQLISAQRHRHENNILGGPDRKGDLTISPLDEEKRTIERIASQLEARRHWKAVSSSSQQALNGSYKEGCSALGVGSSSPVHSGGLNGVSAYYPDIAPSYSSQTEHQLEMTLEYNVQSLDELERRFLEETIKLTKDQNKDEDNENARHRERLREIQEQFQHKMTNLRAKQAKNREEFLRIQAQLRYQIPAASTYSHYQHGDSGGSLPPSSARPASNYNPPLTSSAAYTYPFSQNEGSYEASYEKVNDKRGYEKAGYEYSDAYKKSQVYDIETYSYGTTSHYPACG